MSKAQLVITAVALEGRSKSEVARDYDVSRYWVQQLIKRYESEGTAAFEPHSRRPHHSPRAVGAAVEDKIVRLRKTLAKQGYDAGAATIAQHLTRDPTVTKSACSIDDLADPDPPGLRCSAATKATPLVVETLPSRTAQ
jgi:transposase-like protein